MNKPASLIPVSKSNAFSSSSVTFVNPKAATMTRRLRKGTCIISMQRLRCRSSYPQTGHALTLFKPICSPVWELTAFSLSFPLRPQTAGGSHPTSVWDMESGLGLSESAQRGHQEVDSFPPTLGPKATSGVLEFPYFTNRTRYWERDNQNENLTTA